MKMSNEIKSLDFFLKKAEEISQTYGNINNNPLLKIAALRSTFKMDEIIEEASKLNYSFTREDEDFLKTSSEELQTKKGEKLILKENQRTSILNNPSNQEELRQILEQKSKIEDTTEEMLKQYILGNAPPLSQQDLPELLASYKIAQWLQLSQYNVPTTQDIMSLIKKKEIFEPFRKLTSNFKGRSKELSKISEYVNSRSGSTLEKISSQYFKEFFSWSGKLPLLITGIGGIGKSTLVAKFILQQLDENVSDKTPFIYLDFDKPGLSIADPLALIPECLRQLSLQFKSYEPLFNQIRDELNEVVLYGSNNSQRASTRTYYYNIVTEKYHQEISSISIPILVVFDSFEELQYRVTSSELLAFFDFINEISTIIPSLRPIFVGRSTIYDFPFEHLHLEAFDENSGTGFLQSLGISDPSTCKEIYKYIGGNPLTLQLAADLYNKESKSSLSSIKTTQFFMRLDEKLIQEQLVKRNLEHIHDYEVRKIAVPGMLLRKINPQIIKDILAELCGLGRIDVHEAERIFDNLRKESFLIIDDGESIYFRQDLRIALSNLIHKDKKYKSNEIHVRAISYYKNQEDPAFIAEYLYHLLMIESIKSSETSSHFETLKELYNPTIAKYLDYSIIEFSPEVQYYFDMLKGMVSSKKKNKVSNIEGWEEHYSSIIRDLLKNGDEPGLVKINRELSGKTSRHEKSTLWYWEANLLTRLGMFEKSNNSLDKARLLEDLNRNIVVLESLNKEYLFQFSDASKILSENENFFTEYNFRNTDDINLYMEYWLLRIRLGGRLEDEITFPKDLAFNIARYADNQELPIEKILNESFGLYHYYLSKEFKNSMELVRTVNKKLKTFLNKEEFVRIHQLVIRRFKNSSELERILRENYGLFLKDISGPGALPVLLQDVMKFLEVENNCHLLMLPSNKNLS